MSWSAPCDAIARKAPPIRPAKIVCGRSRPVYRSIALSLFAADACPMMPPHPPATERPSSTTAEMPPSTYTPACTSSVQTTAFMPPRYV